MANLHYYAKKLKKTWLLFALQKMYHMFVQQTKLAPFANLKVGKLKKGKWFLKKEKNLKKCSLLNS